jgi:hypothetical protein
MVSPRAQEQPRGAAGDRLDRLPAFYREQPGPVADLLEAVLASVHDFRRRLEERAGGQLLPGLARPEPGPAAPAVSGAFGTAGELRRWLERAGRVAPRLWPAVRLDELGVSGVGGLRVCLAAPRRHLVVAWPGADAASALPGIRALENLPADRRPVGLGVQFAVVSPAPVDPPVAGSVLQGSLLGTWT